MSFEQYFVSKVPWKMYMKFGHNWPSGRGEVDGNCGQTDGRKTQTSYPIYEHSERLRYRRAEKLFP